MTQKLTLLSAVALLSLLAFIPAARAEEARAPGIVTSTGATVTVSTRAMQPGGEMWALWFQMMPNNKVVTPGTNKSKWVGFELALAGTSNSDVQMPPGLCYAFGPGWLRDLSEGPITSKPGDATICNYKVDNSPWWEENPGPGIYEKAGLYIGGPGVPGDTHIGPEYEKAGGFVRAAGFDADQFKDVFPELLKAGAMTEIIRQVTMMPGARLVADDAYPVLRVVTKGSLFHAEGQPGSDPAAITGGHEEVTGEWVNWAGARRVVLVNTSASPIAFVEWSVVPAPGATP